METELIESKSSHEVIPSARSWPEAPDLQLDCLLTDGDEDETESEVDDEIGEEDSLNDLSDDSSVEVVGVTSTGTTLTSEPGSSAVAADCKPGTSRLISQQPSASDPLSDKCPDFLTAAPAADPLPAQSVPSGASATVKSVPGRAGHLVIDLTHSDDESGLTSHRNNQHNSQQNNNNHRHSIGHHHHHYHHHNSQHNPNRPVHAAAAGQLSRRRTHSQRPIDASAGSRMSCLSENAGHGPVNLTHHQRHSDNPHSASSALPAACRFLTSQHVHHAPGPGHFVEQGSSNNGGNGGPACSSFSNCFVATTSSGNPAAPSSGPCPHAHSFCPQVTSPQVYFPTGAPAHVAAGHNATPSSSSYHLLPPPILHTAPLPGAAGHLFPSFYGPPPAAHSQVPYQTFQINPQQPRMHPVHQQRLLEQQRAMELQRHVFAQHTEGMIRRYVSPCPHTRTSLFSSEQDSGAAGSRLQVADGSAGCRFRSDCTSRSGTPVLSAG